MQCTKILHLKVCKCELESTLQDFLFSNKRESKIHIHVHVNTLYNVRQNNRKWCKTKTGIFAKAGCLIVKYTGTNTLIIRLNQMMEARTNCTLKLQRFFFYWQNRT